MFDVPQEVLNHTPKLLEKKWHLNPETGFLYRHVYGKTEKFVYHTHEFYELFLTMSGKIKHYINDQEQFLEPGCLVFIRPKDRHLYIYQNETDYSFINISLDPVIVNGLFDYLGDIVDRSNYLTPDLPTLVRLTPNEVRSFISKTDEFNVFTQKDITEQKLKIRSFLLNIFVKYFINANNLPSGIPLWVESTYEKMKKPANFIAGIQRMVDISGKTQEHLARSFKKYYNTTLSEFINDLRLAYAANLIKNTNLSITDICYESGFGNITSFYKLFNKTFGMSPKKFRDTK